MSKNCTIGVSCGSTCVSRSFSCSRDLGDDESDFLSSLTKKIKGTTLAADPELREIVSANEELRDVLENGEKIGEGGYGVVYVKDDLAVKLFKYEAKDEDEKELEIATEAGQLGIGPGILEDYRDSSGRLRGIMMERIHGKRLIDVVSEEGEGVRSDEPEIANNLFKKVGEMHKAGIIHGDIHNENVIVRDDNSIVLIDWGMAERTGKGSSSSLRAVADELSSLLDPGNSDIMFPNHRYLSEYSSAMIFLTDNVMRQTPRIYSRMGEVTDYDEVVGSLYDGVL